MQHSRLLAKDQSNVPVYLKYAQNSTVNAELFKINSDGTTNSLQTLTLSWNGEVLTSNFSTPNEDCYLALVVTESSTEHVIIRVGEPAVKVFYSDLMIQADSIVPYRQVMRNGDLISSGNMSSTSIANLWYYNVTSNIESLVTINNKFSEILRLPYIVNDESQGSNGDSVASVAIFLDNTYNYGTFGFSGDRRSQFNYNTGTWSLVDGYTVKASDIMRATAYKYGLSYTDIASPTHISKTIKYIQAYGEEIGSFMVYSPGFTPDDNPNNFTLITDDELGNAYIRGIQIYISVSHKTTDDGSTGIVIPFSNEGMVQ